VSGPAPKPELASLAPFKQGKCDLADFDHPIKLSANESHLGPSPHALEAYRSAGSALFSYPDGSQLALRSAIAETFRLDAARIVCGNGSDELLQLLIRAYVLPGDEVVFSRYSFAMAMVHATAQGAKLVIADEPQLRPDTDALLAAVTPRTRMVFLASPNNPVGLYLPKSELWRLYRALPSNVLLINDSAYADYVIADDFEAGGALLEAGVNAVMTRTFSKLYGLAGLRIGWAYAPVEVIDAVQRIRTPFNASSDAMAAATAAVRDTEYAAYVRDYNAREMQRIRSTVNGLNTGIECLPSFTNFYLLRFKGTRHTPAGAADALEAAGVIPRPVQASGPEGCLRITVGLAHENDIVLKVLTRYMQS
jgi:histidinol-phosphate aminotransferase